jgi:hypothetical protein
VADGVKLEQLGVPTVTVVSTAFVHAARKQAAGRGMAALPVVEIPHPMHSAPHDAVTARADAVMPALVDALTSRQSETLTAVAAHLPEVISLDADLVATEEFFFEQGWSEGLPITPPTRAAVDALLAATPLDRAQTLGPIPPRMRVASVEKIAINAVMAGCKPEYFPVVLAAVEAVLDENCRLYGIQTATNNTTPLLIVNGPAITRLNLNAGGNVFGAGWRANASIGRALQLVLRNLGGDLPGETDMATHGQSGKFSFCIAENEAESPWPPFHVDAGFDATDSTVTVIGASPPHNLFTYGCETGPEILDHFIGGMTALGHNNVIFPTGPLLVIGPEHAGVLARDGINKATIRQAVYEWARIPLARFAPRTVQGLKHRRSRWFELHPDADHIGVADRASDVNIVVAGGAGIHSLFVPTSFSYHPVTKRIRFKS